MTRPDLLRAVLADPADDHARLVYADRLDAEGEHERAEFIRLEIMASDIRKNCQCGGCVKSGQHHNGPCAVAREWIVADGRACRLIARIRLLADVFAFEWFPSIPEGSCSWSRGFIHTLRGPLAALLEHGPRIVAEHPVERVEVTDVILRQTDNNVMFEFHHSVSQDELDFMHSELSDTKYWHNDIAVARGFINAGALREIRRRAKEITQGFSV